MNVLQDVGSESALLQKIAELQAANEALRAKAKRQATQRLRCKVSDKGAVSVYGMGRWPVTLYRSQWDALIGFIPEVQQFLLDNSAALSEKAE